MFDPLMEEIFQDIFNDQFKRGKSDCEQGLEPCSHNPDYMAGYAAQYESEQKKSAIGG